MRFLSAGQGGQFDKFLKRQKILTPLFEHQVRIFPCKIYRIRIGTISALSECLATDFFFFFLFSKADKTNKIDDICFKCKTHFKFKNKSDKIWIKTKAENKPRPQEQMYCKQQ